MSENNIYFWTRHGKYGFLSNFYRAEIYIDSRIWSTIEHYYQAQKTDKFLEQEEIRTITTPREAKKRGKYVTLKQNWEEEKVDVMLEALRAKFIQHPKLRKKLLATGETSLHENSPTDMFWGAKGKNMLGKLLMQVREELR